jgi:hypothetical protein
MGQIAKEPKTRQVGKLLEDEILYSPPLRDAKCRAASDVTISATTQTWALGIAGVPG